MALGDKNLSKELSDELSCLCLLDYTVSIIKVFALEAESARKISHLKNLVAMIKTNSHFFNSINKFPNVRELIKDIAHEACQLLSSELGFESREKAMTLPQFFSISVAVLSKNILGASKIRQAILTMLYEPSKFYDEQHLLSLLSAIEEYIDNHPLTIPADRVLLLNSFYLVSYGFLVSQANSNPKFITVEEQLSSHIKKYDKVYEIIEETYDDKSLEISRDSFFSSDYSLQQFKNNNNNNNNFDDIDLISNSVWSDKLYQLILSRRIQRDSILGIKSALLKVNDKWVYYRDAMGISDITDKMALQLSERHNAIMMAYNYLLAYHELLGITERASSSSRVEAWIEMIPELLLIAQKPLEILSSWCDVILLKDLYDRFDEKSPKKIKQLFNRMTHAVAMHQPSMDVITTISLDKKTITIHESPITAINQSYIDEINDRNEKLWYQALSKEDQLVVEKYLVTKLLSGQSLIPSQLRDLVPGLRNCYQTSVKIEGELVFQSIHTGTVVTLVKPERYRFSQPSIEMEMKRLTALNLKLLKDAINDDARIHMASLNSDKADLFCHYNDYAREAINNLPALFSRHKSIKTIQSETPYFADDRPIVQITASAHNPEENIFVSNYVFNGFRVISSDDLTGTRCLLQYFNLIVKNCGQGLSNELFYLLDELEFICDQRNNAVSLIAENIKRSDLMDKEFIGKRILELTTQINTKIINYYTRKKQTKGLMHLAFGCASGENRTYVGLFLSILNSIEAYCNENAISAEKDAMAMILTSSYHCQDMIGGQGGVLGACGARYKSKGSWPEELRNYVDIFYQHIADIKKSVKSDSKIRSPKQQKIKNIIDEVIIAICDSNSDYNKSNVECREFTFIYNGKKYAGPAHYRQLIDTMNQLNSFYQIYSHYGSLSKSQELGDFITLILSDTELYPLLTKESQEHIAVLSYQLSQGQQQVSNKRNSHNGINNLQFIT